MKSSKKLETFLLERVNRKMEEIKTSSAVERTENRATW